MNYGNLTDIQRFIMALFTILTLTASIPPIFTLFSSKSTRMEAFILFMATFSAFFYHLSEVINAPILLDEWQWHRLDNIFVITCIGLAFLKLLGLELLRWPNQVFLGISTISQILDPWNFSYTLVPIISFGIISIVLRILTYSKYEVKYSIYNLLMYFGILGFGASYMIEGLNEYEDYLRHKHALWHLFSGLSIKYLFNVCQVSQRKEDVRK